MNDETSEVDTNEDNFDSSSENAHNASDDNNEYAQKSEIVIDADTEINLSAAFDKLFEHQIDAVRFLYKNCIKQNAGCIVAHHMGLGKTLSTIAFLNTIATAPTVDR